MKDMLLGPIILGPIAFIVRSPFSVKGMSVVPVYLNPLLDDVVGVKSGVARVVEDSHVGH